MANKRTIIEVARRGRPGGGGGAVDSVNGQTGVVSLDFYTQAEVDALIAAAGGGGGGEVVIGDQPPMAFASLNQSTTVYTHAGTTDAAVTGFLSYVDHGSVAIDPEQTVSFIGDLHYGSYNSTPERRDTAAADLATIVDQRSFTVLMGDLVEDDISADAAALAFVDAIGAADSWEVMVGNHDAFSALRTVAQARTAWGKTGTNWTQDVGDFKLIGLQTDDIAGTGSPMIVSSGTLDWLDATLAATTKNCILVTHAPLQDSTAGTSTTNTYIRDSALIRAVLADHPHARACISGHTHYSVEIDTETLGGRTFYNINTSALAWVRPWSIDSPLVTDALRSIFITFASDHLVVRVRDHKTGTWASTTTVDYVEIDPPSALPRYVAQLHPAMTSYIANPSAVTNTSSWTTGAGRSITRVTSLPAPMIDGLSATVTTAIQVAATAEQTGEKAGTWDTYTVSGALPTIMSAYVYIPTAWTGGTIAIGDTAASFAGSIGSARGGEADMGIRDAWQRISVGPFTPASGDLGGSLTVYQVSGTWPIGQSFYVTAAQAEHGTTLTPFEPSMSRVATQLAIPYTGDLGTVSFRYFDPGDEVWSDAVLTAAGSFGTTGTMAVSGTHITFSTTGGVLLDSVRVDDPALTSGQQAALFAKSRWAWQWL